MTSSELAQSSPQAPDTSTATATTTLSSSAPNPTTRKPVALGDKMHCVWSGDGLLRLW